MQYFPDRKFYLVLFKVCSDSPALVISKCVSVLLEEGVDTWNTSVPGVLQIFQCQTSDEYQIHINKLEYNNIIKIWLWLKRTVPVLSNGLLTLEGVFSPNSLRVNELALPWLDVTIQIRNQLILLVTHSRAEMSDSHISLFGPPEHKTVELSSIA